MSCVRCTSLITVSCFIGIALGGMLVGAGCRQTEDPQELAAIAWAKKNGLRIDEWQAGELPDEHFDERAWIEEGRAIQDVERLLRRLLEKRDQRIDPILLVGAMGYVGTEESVPLLIEQLNDKWDVMRAEATWALGRIGGTEAIRALAGQLKYATTSTERRCAARAFVELGLPVGIEVMEGALAEIEEEQVFLEQALADLRRKVATGNVAGSRPASQATTTASSQR
jgi:hypothetical protein